MVSVLVGFSSTPSAKAWLAAPAMTSGVKLVAPITLSSVRRSMFVMALLLMQKMVLILPPMPRSEAARGPPLPTAGSVARSGFGIR